ncbi:unnamed protein product, partial [Laminaria digitata]
YSQSAADAIPKRSTVYRGEPFDENTDFKRDRGLVVSAISYVTDQ